MMEHKSIFSFLAPGKTIFCQLCSESTYFSGETHKFTHHKLFGQDLLLKQFMVLNDERLSFIDPFQQRVSFLQLAGGYLDEGVEVLDEMVIIFGR